MTSLPVRLRPLLRNAVLWNVSARGAELGAAAAGTWLVARTGGASGVGVYTLLRILPASLSVMTAGGLPGAVTYFLAGPTRSDARVRSTLLAVALAGAAGGCVLWVAATPLLHRLFFADLSPVLVAAAGGRMFTYLSFSTGRACLQGLGDITASNWVILGEDLFFLPALLACWAAGVAGSAALVGALLLGDAANGALAWRMLARRGFFGGFAPPSPELARRMYGFGVRGQVGNLLLLLNLRLDFAILGALAGAAPLGVYALASRFAELLRLLPVSVFWVLYPEYARTGQTIAASRARALIPRLGALTLAAAIPLGLASGVVLPWLFGPAFQAAVLPSQILLVGLVAEGVGGVVTPYLYGEGRPGLNSLAMGAGVVVTVLLDVLLIPRFAALGAAVASSAAYATTTAVLLVIFQVRSRAAAPPVEEGCASQASPVHLRRRDPRNPGNVLMARERDATLHALLPHALPGPIAARRVLDVGCGRGDVLGWFQQQGVEPANLVGVDLSPSRVEEARRRHPLLDIRVGNAVCLELPRASFDLVLCFTLFSSLLEPVTARRVARNITLVLRPGGSILWYDIRYPNPWNRAVRPMTRGRIRELFPGFRLDLCTLTAVPQLARHLGPVAEPLYPLLVRVPPLRTHHVGLLTRDGP